MTSNAYWRKLAASGWLNYLPSEKHQDIRDHLAKTLKRGTKDACFTLATVAFDTECIYEEDDYKKILRELADASLGNFRPSAIKVRLDQALGVAEISFKHARETFACEVPFETDWFDMDVLDLVNQALAFSGTAARFIPLPSEDQLLFLVFVPQTVYERAAEEKLVPKNASFLRKLTRQAVSDKQDRIDKKLVAALRSSDWATRHFAVMKLGETRAKAKAAFALLQEATRDVHPCVREAAASALPRVGAEAVPFLEALLHDQDGIVRVKAACSLLRIGNHARGVAVLCHEFQSGRRTQSGREARVKGNALYELADMGSAAAPALPAILLALGDPFKSNRHDAFNVLNILGPLAKPALRHLISLLRGKNKRDLSEAAYTLGCIGPAAAKAVPDLISLLQEKESEIVRDSAITALGMIGPDAERAVPLLARALIQGHGETPWRAAEALGKIGSPVPEAIEALLQAIKSKHAHLRLIAARSLSLLDLKEARKALPVLLEDYQSNVYSRNEIGSVIRAIDPKLAKEHGIC